LAAGERAQAGRPLTRHATPYLFVAPFFVLFLTFVGWPVVHSIWLSMHDTIGLESRVFVGGQNFVDLVQDAVFWKACKNTLVFALSSLFIQLPLSLLLAIVLNSKRVRGTLFFRFAFFSPVLVAGVFIAIIFTLVFNHEYGLLNHVIHTKWVMSILNVLGVPSLLSLFGISLGDLDWLRDEKLVMTAIVITGVWRWTGFNMIYFLAGLQSIRQELYEAAAIDGAGPWAAFRHVTLPGLRPILIFVVVMSTIGSVQLFDLPYILLGGGGPNDAGLTVVMYLYRTGFQYMRLGYAATIGWAVFALVFVVALIQMKILTRSDR
jgi:ABC-type sugar transport system permease subunit